MFRYQNQGVDQMGLLRPVVAQSENKCPTNFSLSPRFDKLKLVGHQTDTLSADADGTDPIDLLEVAQ